MPEKVIGIGVDTTGSSPIPVDEQNRALAMKPEWKRNLSAECWLRQPKRTGCRRQRSLFGRYEKRTCLIPIKC